MDLKNIFDYFKDNEVYTDISEEYYVREVSEEENKLQDQMEQFTFDILQVYARQNKYYYDESNCFENYTFYVKYQDIKLTIFIMFGQGSFFSVTKSDKEFREDLCINID